MKQSHKVQKVSKSTNGLALLLQRVVSGMCLIVMFATPLAPIFAAGEDGVSMQPQVENVATETTPPEEPESPPTEEVTEEIVDSEINVETEEQVLPVETPVADEEPKEDTQNQTSSDTAVVSELSSTSSEVETLQTETNTQDSNAVPTDSVVDQTATSSNDLTNAETTTDATTSIPSPVTEEIITTEPEVTEVPTENPPLVNTASSTEEISTEPAVGETVTLSAITNDENRFVFGKSECVPAGDGTFFCTKGVVDSAPSHTDRVFSAVDADGDKEILIERNSNITQITSNTVDDDAPYFDELTNSLVWHRLIEGRYQIISYDVETKQETQLTHDRFNNMEPHRYGDTTVWQGWIGNDWEIMMLQNDELTMLTDNTTHDITPSINGDHVVWQSFEGDSWKMKVYDIRTKEIQTIEDSAGGSIENPRFVLVYDAKLETGDVETRGFNLETGEVVSLGAKPVSVPEDIPDPDQTGEKRAIVTPAPQPKTKIDESDDDTPDVVGGNDPPLDLDGAQNGDIVIPALGIGTTTQLVGTSTVMEVTIPALDTVSSSSVAHIEDLVIPSFNGTSTVSEDSQVPIVPVS